MNFFVLHAQIKVSCHGLQPPNGAAAGTLSVSLPLAPSPHSVCTVFKIFAFCLYEKWRQFVRSIVLEKVAAPFLCWPCFRICQYNF